MRPEVVVEVTYLTWTEDNLLRQVSYRAQREDKSAGEVVRAVRHPPGLHMTMPTYCQSRWTKRSGL